MRFVIFEDNLGLLAIFEWGDADADRLCNTRDVSQYKDSHKRLAITSASTSAHQHPHAATNAAAATATTCRLSSSSAPRPRRQSLDGGRGCRRHLVRAYERTAARRNS